MLFTSVFKLDPSWNLSHNLTSVKSQYNTIKSMNLKSVCKVVLYLPRLVIPLGPSWLQKIILCSYVLNISSINNISMMQYENCKIPRMHPHLQKWAIPVGSHMAVCLMAYGLGRRGKGPGSGDATTAQDVTQCPCFQGSPVGPLVFKGNAFPHYKLSWWYPLKFQDISLAI